MNAMTPMQFAGRVWGFPVYVASGPHFLRPGIYVSLWSRPRPRILNRYLCNVRIIPFSRADREAGDE